MADSDRRLAVVVPERRAQTAIGSLRAEGVYDADRSVQPWDDDSVAVPVTAPPEATRHREVVRQVGEPRLRGLDDRLRDRGWRDAEIERAPSSWAVVGSVVLVDVDGSPRPEEVGEALLAVHGEADTVLARGGIEGPHREPDPTVVAGAGDTETVHTEHGIDYGLDLAEVMFSPGNKAERVRMGEAVEAGESEQRAPAESASGGTASSERVLDMFAGIGYFTLPMAAAGARVTAVERNPTAFQFLVENLVRNGVSDRVQPYRADCRDVVPGFADEAPADRVVMGHYDAYEYLDAALDALAAGGTLHMHEATPDPLVFDRPVERLEAAAADADRSVEVLDTRRVKSYSEGVAHVVVDARVE